MVYRKSENLIEKEEWNQKCAADRYYDRVIKICQSCSTCCPPRPDNRQCKKYCNLETICHESHSQLSHPAVIIGLIVSAVLIVLLLLLFCKRKDAFRCLKLSRNITQPEQDEKGSLVVNAVSTECTVAADANDATSVFIPCSVSTPEELRLASTPEEPRLTSNIPLVISECHDNLIVKNSGSMKTSNQKRPKVQFSDAAECASSMRTKDENQNDLKQAMEQRVSKQFRGELFLINVP